MADFSVFARPSFTFKNTHAAVFPPHTLLVGSGFPGEVSLSSLPGPGGSSKWEELCWGKLTLDWPGMGLDQLLEGSGTWAASWNKKHTGTPGKGGLSSNNPLDNSFCEPNKWGSGNQILSPLLIYSSVSSETPNLHRAKGLTKVRGWGIPNSGLNGEGFVPKHFL